MRNISALIQRFSTLLDKKTVSKEVVAQAVRECTGRDLSPENVSINGTVLEISSSPVFHTEIKLKEEAILSKLRLTHNLHISRILYK